MRRRRLLAVAFAAGAVTAYLYDPENGPERRAKLREQSQPRIAKLREQSQPQVAKLREQTQPLLDKLREQSQPHIQRVSEAADKRRRYVSERFAEARGRTTESESGQFHPESEVDLREHLRKVLADLAFPTADVNVDVVNGAATLRGQLQSDDEMRAAIDAVQGVEGVWRVESYLHLPGMPAPNKADALRAT